MAAERETVDRLIAYFLADRVGATFAGRIAGVNRAGLFVRLNDTGADGFIPVASMERDHYIHDEGQMTLTGRRTGESFRLGDRVEVRLVEAVPLAGALRFELLSEGRYVEPTSGFGKRRGRRLAGHAPPARSGARKRKASQMTAVTLRNPPPTRLAQRHRAWPDGALPGLRGRQAVRTFPQARRGLRVLREDLSHQRADDLPPYIVITIVGHIVVGGMVVSEQMNLDWSYGTHALVWGTMNHRPVAGDDAACERRRRRPAMGQPYACLAARRTPPRPGARPVRIHDRDKRRNHADAAERRCARAEMAADPAG